jgi:formate hydrogenlyase transcriptional activator
VPASLDSESIRSSSVQRYVRLLARSPVDSLRKLVDVAARVCATPSAAISVVDESAQSFVVTSGLAVPPLPRAQAFCGRAILQDDPFVVPNAFLDERFRSSPIVLGNPQIRFYAGMPLVTSGHCRIGTLCVFDSSPRNLSENQLDALRTLGRSVVSELEVLRLGAEVELKSKIIENSSDCVKVLSLDANLLSMNAGGMAALEIADFETVAGSSWVDFWKGEDRDKAAAAVETARQGGVGRFVGFFATAQTHTPRWWHVVVSPLPGESGGVESLLAISRDITDLKHAEDERAKAEARERAILEVNNAIISNLTEASLLGAISQALQRVVPFDRAALTLYVPETDQLRILALEGRLPPQSYPVGVTFDRQDSHVGWVFDRQCTLLRRDLERERQFTPEHRLYDEGIRCLCTAPLVLGGKSIGTITIGSTTALAFDEETERFLGEVGKQIALAVSNMRAFEEIAALRARLQAENVYLQEEIHSEHNYSEIVGRSPALLGLLAQVEQVAPADTTVLVTGETGTGKELFARAIHERSGRKERPLVKVNCGALSAGLIESELFGHLKGAFTGALQNRDGRFKLADGGTVFLDEVGELPPEAQVKLLRVLQEHEFEPVGSGKSVKVNVRVIAATNRDLEADVAAGRFRSDLYYRLNVFPIRVPPLRERGDDIELLVHFFVQKYAKSLGRKVSQIARETMQRLHAYAWPGNIRELQNVIERAVVLSRTDTLSLPGDFAPSPAPQPSKAAGRLMRAAAEALDDVERSHIEAVLAERNWTIEGERGAAKVLKIHPNTLRSRMRKLGLKRPSGRA